MEKMQRATSTVSVVPSVAPTPLMKDGELVILYCGRENIVPLTLKANAIFRNKHGEFRHNDMIGKPIGSRVKSSGKRDKGGFIYALRPTPELWTAGALRHRTQIIYSVDISMIIFHLQLKPGQVVVESGTGSGSLSRSFARVVAPHGHLYTFEFHAQRASANRDDFVNEGLGDLITVTHRDACAGGFKTEKLGESGADAVFLDLPSPWDAVDHAAAVLRTYGRLCAFTPSIEQVQRTYQALYAAGFDEIKTIECLLRPYRIHPETVERYDLSALFAPEVVEPEASEAEAPMMDTTATTASAAGAEEVTNDEDRSRKRAREDFEAGASANNPTDDKKEEKADNMEEEANTNANDKNEAEEKTEEATITITNSSSSSSSSVFGRGARKEKKAASAVVPLVHERPIIVEPLAEIRGHTSFLTFAVKFPRSSSSTASSSSSSSS